MKKRWTATIILISIFILFIGSCASSNGLCQQDEIMKKLEHSGTEPEFVADGVYYCLPCTIDDFLDQGWSVGEVVIKHGERYYIEEYLIEGHYYEDEKVKRLDEIECPGESTVQITLFKLGKARADEVSLTYLNEEKTLQLTISNPSAFPLEIRSCKVVSTECSGKDSAGFVTWYGICCETSRKMIYKLAEKNHLVYETQNYGGWLFSTATDSCYLSSQDGKRMIQVTYLDYGKTLKSIRVYTSEQ